MTALVVYVPAVLALLASLALLVFDDMEERMHRERMEALKERWP